MKISKLYLFSILIFLSACSASVDYAGIKVIDVIDGDTIKLENGQLLRYIGIDTPETRVKIDNEFVYRPQPYSREATEFNRNLVRGRRIRVEFDLDKRDRYNRLLGYCFVDDLFVNAKLLEEGLATLYTCSPNIKYTGLFAKIQKQAKEERRGLWSSYKIIEAENAHKYINQLCLVKGRVLSIHQSKKCVYLNFGKDHKTDFTIVIFNDILDLFREKNIDPETYYKGKEVEVTGRVRGYNGPEIIVNSPFEIKVIE